MKLTGAQIELIQNAILDAFNREELRRIVRICMNEDFDDLVPDGALTVQVFALIQWAERKSRAQELIQCAYNGNPDNVQLRAMYVALSPSLATPVNPQPAQERHSKMPSGGTILGVVSLLITLIAVLFGDNLLSRFASGDVLPTPTVAVALDTSGIQPPDGTTPAETDPPTSGEQPVSSSDPLVASPPLTLTATVAPESPTVTATSTPTLLPPTATATDTATPLPPTATATDTATPLPPTATATDTPTPIPPTATATDPPTPIPPTPVPPTATPVPNTPTPDVNSCPIAADADLARYWKPSVGCPTGSSALVWASYTPFQKGFMMWRSDTGRIYGFFNGVGWTDVADIFHDGMPDMPESNRGQAPSGFIHPIRGTGLVWATNDTFFRNLGWATDQQRGFCAEAQQYENGFILRESGASQCTDLIRGEPRTSRSQEPGFDFSYVVAILSDRSWDP